MITAYFTPKPKRSNGKTASGSNKRAKMASGETNDCETDASSGSDSPPKTEQLPPEVADLLSYLDRPDEEGLKSWHDVLSAHASSSSFVQLARFVAKERNSHTIYPPAHDTFSALNLTPFHSVKLVIVGQDPYHGPNQAHGLCFSVKKGVTPPPSLKNIYNELRDDPQVNFPANGVMPSHGCLERWARQGVLLLNNVLTVRKGVAFSHRKKGWEQVTDALIRALDRESRASERGLVFLLWGKPASVKAQSVVHSNRRHTIICTSHPSPLGARKTASPFLGSRCFSRANQALQELGHDPIDWNVDGPL